MYERIWVIHFRVVQMGMMVAVVNLALQTLLRERIMMQLNWNKTYPKWLLTFYGMFKTVTNHPLSLLMNAWFLLPKL